MIKSAIKIAVLIISGIIYIIFTLLDFAIEMLHIFTNRIYEDVRAKFNLIIKWAGE